MEERTGKERIETMGRRGRENGTVSGAGYKVDVIPAKKHLTPARRNLHEASDMRVAAYCRVSTGDESQQTSYTKQKAFYTELIQKRAGWKLAGIYAEM